MLTTLYLEEKEKNTEELETGLWYDDIGANSTYTRKAINI